MRRVPDVVRGDLEPEAVSLPPQPEPRPGRQLRLEPGLVEPRRADLARLVRDVRGEDVEPAAAPARNRLTARQRRILARPSLISRIWMATGKKVYLFVTRRIFRWRDREGAGDRGAG